MLPAQPQQFAPDYACPCCLGSLGLAKGEVYGGHGTFPRGENDAIPKARALDHRPLALDLHLGQLQVLILDGV